MREIQKQECPLCGNSARYYKVDHGRLKYFECEKCTYFQISDHAERKLGGAPKAWKEAMSRKAQETPVDHLLVIGMSRVGNDNESRAQELISEYKPKSECSR